MKSRATHLRAVLMRWHRRLGLCLLISVCLVCITGVLIQFSHTLGWDRQALRHPTLLQFYGVKPVQIASGFRIDDTWYSVKGGELYRQATPLMPCQRLIGAIEHLGLHHVACEGQLILLTPDGETVEVLPTPARLTRLGHDGERIVGQWRTRLTAYDDVRGQWQDVSAAPTHWSRAQALPDALRDALSQLTVSEGITRERLLLDLHSGRLFGAFGEWVVNLTGLGLMVLAMTGAMAWWKRLR